VAPIPSLADLPDMAAAAKAEVTADSEDLAAWERWAVLTELTEPESVRSTVLRAYGELPLGSAILDGLLQNSAQTDPPLSLAERAARAGQLMAAEGDWRLAGAAWKRALELEPAFPEAEAYLGLALSRNGEDGLPWLLRASAEAPGDPVIRSLLGQYWLGAGEAASAVRELDYAARLDPSNPATAAALGAALAQAGRLAEAEQSYRRAADLKPQDPAFWLLMAEFSLRYDYLVDSVGLPAARNAAALDPEDAAANSALGLALALSGDTRSGERLLLHALELAPQNALAWYRYALILLEQGRMDEARRSLSAAIDLDPGGLVAQLADGALQNLAAGSP
jgi:Flp pilus assembly protein TadD